MLRIRVYVLRISHFVLRVTHYRCVSPTVRIIFQQREQETLFLLVQTSVASLET